MNRMVRCFRCLSAVVLVCASAPAALPERGMIAHRGDAADYPENTIPAFTSAVAKGAEMVELDEWRCKTGELVVLHDPKVDRTTNGHGRIADLTFAEIKSLDAGVRKGAAFAGTRVPTLEEALAAFPKTGVWLNIHCKTGSAAPEVAEILRRTGRLAQGILMFDSRADLVALRKVCPEAKTGLVMGGWKDDKADERLRDAVSLGVAFVQMLPQSHLTKEQLAFLHDHGVRTTYFYANDAKTMAELVAEGHDFIFTDFFSKLRNVYGISQKPHSRSQKATLK